jgi:hypothetical protein
MQSKSTPGMFLSRHVYIWVLILAVLALTLRAEAKVWAPLSPDPANINAAQNANYASAVFGNGTFYVAFVENNPVYGQAMWLSGIGTGAPGKRWAMP